MWPAGRLYRRTNQSSVNIQPELKYRVISTEVDAVGSSGQAKCQRSGRNTHLIHHGYYSVITTIRAVLGIKGHYITHIGLPGLISSK